MKQKSIVSSHNIIHIILIIIENLVKGSIFGLLYFALGIAGYYIFITKASPYDILIGLPLFLAGIGLAINSFFSIVLSIFIPRYNKGVCRWCG